MKWKYLFSHFVKYKKISRNDQSNLLHKKYKWILNNQVHHTTFKSLFSLESIRGVEVTFHLLIIFLTFSASKILQSDNVREFVNSTINDIKELRFECIIKCACKTKTSSESRKH